MTGRIRLLVLDVDGVITDGTVMLLPSGDEIRSLHFRDLDAVTKVRQYDVIVAILSGEDTASSHRVAERFRITEAVWGAKDKLTGLRALVDRLGIPLTETCYVADADRDAPALAAAAVGLAPADATAAATQAADHVLTLPGGRGVVAEAVTWLEGRGHVGLSA